MNSIMIKLQVIDNRLSENKVSYCIGFACIEDTFIIIIIIMHRQDTFNLFAQICQIFASKTRSLTMTYLARDLVKNGILSSLAPSLEHVRRVFPEAAADRKLLNLAPFSLSFRLSSHLLLDPLPPRGGRGGIASAALLSLSVGLTDIESAERVGE